MQVDNIWWTKIKESFLFAELQPSDTVMLGYFYVI